MNNELAARIFNDIFDDDDLNKMHRSKIIAQPLGFKLSCIATIEVAIDEYCDRLAEENAKLRGALLELLECKGILTSDKECVINAKRLIKDQNNGK